MNVLFLANSFPSPDKKNAGPFNLRAVHNLRADGMQVEVLHTRSWKPWRKPMEVYEIEGVKITAISLPYFNKLPAFLLGLNLAIYKKIFLQLYASAFRKGRFEVLHSVGAGHAGVLASALSKAFNVAHVAQCIGSDVNIWLPRFKDSIGFRNWQNYVDVFTCNSIELKNQVNRLYPGADARVLYRGVNLKEFHPDLSKRKNEYVQVSFLGGLLPKEIKPYGPDQKGGVTMLRSWIDAVKSEPAFPGILKYGGPGVNKERVAEIIGDDPSKYRIDVIGHMDRKQVFEFFQESDIVVLPSKFEGLPNVAMEAAASGCALIGSNVGGIPEVILHGKNGFIFQHDEPAELTGHLLSLLKDRPLLHRFQEESRHFMEVRFDSKQFAEEYIALYKEVSRKRK